MTTDRCSCCGHSFDTHLDHCIEVVKGRAQGECGCKKKGDMTTDKIYVVFDGFPPDDDSIDSTWTEREWAEARLRYLRQNGGSVKQGYMQTFLANKPDGEIEEEGISYSAIIMCKCGHPRKGHNNSIDSCIFCQCPKYEYYAMFEE